MQILNTEVALHDLRFHACHGVLPQERKIGADFTLNLRLQISDTHPAMLYDRLEGTVSYADVYEIARREMSIPSALLEHAAARIAQALFDNFPKILSLVIDLRKDNPPIGADCAGCSVRFQATR